MDFLFLGLALGLSAGISPGPLLTLVISTSLERGFGAGFRVAIAPLLTDTPVILISMIVLKELPGSFLHSLGALGGLLLVYLGVKTATTVPVMAGESTVGRGKPQDLLKGALVNLLNPHPWLSWATVMGPLLLQSWRQGPLGGVAFIASFYLAIVGSKVTIAWLVARGRRSLSGRWYRRLLQACGMLLVALGLLLIVRTLRQAI